MTIKIEIPRRFLQSAASVEVDLEQVAKWAEWSSHKAEFEAWAKSDQGLAVMAVGSRPADYPAEVVSALKGAGLKL